MKSPSLITDGESKLHKNIKASNYIQRGRKQKKFYIEEKRGNERKDKKYKTKEWDARGSQTTDRRKARQKPNATSLNNDSLAFEGGNRTTSK